MSKLFQKPWRDGLRAAIARESERMDDPEVGLSAPAALHLLDCADALAAAIRALPLAEAATLTPREKLRRVREARELLATARVAFVPRGAGFVTDEATGKRIADWRWGPEDAEVVTGRPYVVRSGRLVPYSGSLLSDARTWVLDTLRAEGWDVVEEGEG